MQVQSPLTTTVSCVEKRRPARFMAIGQRNFAVRISDDLAGAFNLACKERGANMTLIIKQLMADYIQS